RGAVGGRLLDERSEERAVLRLLRVPQDAECEALRGVLDRLQGAVVRPRRLAQTLAHAPEALVMVRLHGCVRPDDGAEPALRIDPDPVRREDARRLAVPLVSDHLRQVLDEVAAAGDVQELAAAADGEYGHVALERFLE